MLERFTSTKEFAEGAAANVAVEAIVMLLDANPVPFTLRASIVYVAFATRLSKVRVVTAPLEDVLTSNAPVVMARVVPVGLLLSPRVTVALVVYITKLEREGGTRKVVVEAVTLVGCVEPPTFKLPAYNP